MASCYRLMANHQGLVELNSRLESLRSRLYGARSFKENGSGPQPVPVPNGVAEELRVVAESQAVQIQHSHELLGELEAF